MTTDPLDPLKQSWCVCDGCLVPRNPRHAHQKLIKNVSIFTGEKEELIVGHCVVIEGHKIHSIISADGCAEEEYEQVIDGEGGFLTPGLIDVHWHTMMPLPLATVMNKNREYVAAVSTVECKKVLMRGVTTVRDAAGDVFGIKHAIDDGYIQGPRIYPSGAILSQCSGHGDFRNPRQLPHEWGGNVSSAEELGFVLLCNGPDQVLAATRHNLFHSATQIKMAVTGGVISYGDPLYVNEFFEEEINMAVRAAEDFGTYVMVHCHSSDGARRALKAGVKSFDHISSVDEETVKLLADAGVVASIQVKVLQDVATQYPKGDPRQVKGQLRLEKAHDVCKYAKKHGLSLAWGTDLLDSVENRSSQLEDLAMRTKFGFTSAELMIQATGNGGKTVGLCGKRNPYGKVGVIEPGAMADILIYSKNPLEDIKVVQDHEETLKLVIKDGDIVKHDIAPVVNVVAANNPNPNDASASSLFSF